MISAATAVLVVEDDPALRQALADFFMVAGFVVRTAAHGVEALRTLDRETPDIIVLDLILPWVNGIEVLATLREHPAHAPIPVLVTTGTATSDFDLRAYRPLKVLHKPVNFDALLPTIDALLLEARLHRPAATKQKGQL